MALVVNGDGNITGLTAGGLPDASITQAELATNVAGNGPAFSAYPSGSQTLSSTTATKLLFALEEYDTNNNFTSSRFTPTVAGYYYVAASIQVSSTWTGGYIAFYRNGSEYKINGMVNSGAGDTGTFGSSCVVYCNGSTDYIEAYGFIGNGQALTGTSVANWFQGYMVRAA